MIPQSVKDGETLELLTELYDAVTEAVESLEVDNIGACLAWLTHAILTERDCEWPEDHPFVRVLRKCFDEPDDRVWKFITISQEGSS